MHLSLATLVVSLFSSSILAATSSSPPSLSINNPLETNLLTGRTSQGLNDAALAAGKLYFGTATDPVSFGDGVYMGILNGTTGAGRDFGGVSVENAMKVRWVFFSFSVGEGERGRKRRKGGRVTRKGNGGEGRQEREQR